MPLPIVHRVTVLSPGAGGDSMDEAEVTYPDGSKARREVVVLGGGAYGDEALSLNTQPTGSEYAIPVRTIAGAGTQPISVVSLPLPTGAAQDGTDGASPPAIPGTGIRGWLRSIYDKLAGTLQVSQPQTVDAGNTVTVSNANASPGSPFVGAWSHTRSLGIVRQITVLASNVSSGLGGIFTFEYSEDGISNNGISEVRTIGSFSTVRDFDLLNSGEYYRIKFEPSRALAGGELVFITTTMRRQWDGFFVRLLTQPLEKQNLGLPHLAAFLRGFKADGTSTDIGITPTAALRTGTEDAATGVSSHVSSLRDTVFGARSRVFGDNFATGIGVGIDQGSFPTTGTVTGSGTVAVAGGSLNIRTGATLGSTASMQSTKTALFRAGNEAGHFAALAFPASPSIFRVGSRKAAVNSYVASASFSSNAPTTDANFHLYDLYFNGQDSFYFQGEVLLHTLRAMASPLVGALDLPIRFEVDNFSTTIAAGSNGQSLPQATINVASTANFPTSGTVAVVTGAGTQLVSYTGVAGGNQFTGCTGGTGAMSTGGGVQVSVLRWGQFDANNGYFFEVQYQATDITLAVIETAALQYGSASTDILALTRWQASQVTVGTSAVQIASSPLTARKTISLKGSTSSNQTVYVGATSAVTASTGYALGNGETLDLDLDDGAQVWAIASSSAQKLFIAEIG